MHPSFSRSLWRKRSQRSKPLFISVSLIVLLLLLIFLSSYAGLLRSFFPLPSLPLAKTLVSLSPLCGPITNRGAIALSGEKFLWYAPHSGFSNQQSELKNAILVAAILNRTLIVPPVLDHHAVALGSCPKFRVSSPSDLRTAVWDHIMELVRDRRYVSIADIVDLSSIRASKVKLVDFRVFGSLWCGINMDRACYGNLCCAMSGAESLSNSFNQCKSLLSGLHGNIARCTYALEEDCRTTVWTYQQENDEILDVLQPDKQLREKKNISYVRKRRDIYKAFGPGSNVEMATLIAFGSLFSASYKGSDLYIDIHEAPRDSRIESLLKKIEFLPFAPEIVSAGKEFAVNKIKEPFLCAQLRLLDGQFKNHWKTTFAALEQKIQSLQMEAKGNKVPSPIHIFIMTDLPTANWTGTYLGDLAKSTNSHKLYTLQEGDELVVQAARRLMAAEHGMRSGFLPWSHAGMKNNRVCGPGLLPDILLYIEEIVCCCASMGFVGTVGSTIAESIKIARQNNVCKL